MQWSPIWWSAGLGLVLTAASCATSHPAKPKAEVRDLEGALVALHEVAQRNDERALAKLSDTDGRFALAYAASKWLSVATGGTGTGPKLAVMGIGFAYVWCLLDQLIVGVECVLEDLVLVKVPKRIEPLLPRDGPLADGVLTAGELEDAERNQRQKTLHSLREKDLRQCTVKTLTRVDPTQLQDLVSVSPYVATRWLARVEGIYVAEVSCAGEDGVVVATNYSSQVGLKLLLWKFAPTR